MVCGRFAVAATVRVAAAVQSCPHPPPLSAAFAAGRVVRAAAAAPVGCDIWASSGAFPGRLSDIAWTVLFALLSPVPFARARALFHLSCARSRRLNFLLHPSISIARGHIDLMNACQSFSFPSPVRHERLTIHTHPFPPVVRGVFAFYCPPPLPLPPCLCFI